MHAMRIWREERQKELKATTASIKKAAIGGHDPIPQLLLQILWELQ
jgi:hypothetical protein